MPIRERLVDYRDGDTQLEGYLAWDDAQTGPRPTVLVVHAYGGRGEFECERARELAALGYAGFAVDIYGKGIFSTEPGECEALMQPFVSDRNLLLRRLELGLAAAGAQPEADQARAAAIGYCFGGLCVLDMARAGMPLVGVVSLHGLFNPPPVSGTSPIDTRILVLHGWDDPMVLPADVLALADELSARQADWQIHGYGGTYHAFTNPHANAVDRGVLYNADAARRSAQSVENFLGELLG
jgi:dienelactone hydrolase